MRRNRKSESIRSLVKETHLLPSQFIVPFFLIEGKENKKPIAALPGIFRMSGDLILEKIYTYHKKGVQAFALFPVIPKESKSPQGKEALNPHSFLIQNIRMIKKEIPSICLITDIALDPFTSHGHDGLLSEEGEILNDPTIEILNEMALIHAEAGIDMVAPSDMMDGRIGSIRKTLDRAGFTNTSILAYSAKYASSFYAPFRDALGSTLAKGNKKTYQMDPSNQREAVLEALIDLKEGADIIMVKPAGFYLDVIAKIKEKALKPVAAYHVSGEFAMILAAHEKGYLNADLAFFEVLLSIKRAGADMIFTYAIDYFLRTFQ